MTLPIVELADKISDSANAKLFTKLGWLEAVRALREYKLSDPEIEAWMRSQHPQLACDHALHTGIQYHVIGELTYHIGNVVPDCNEAYVVKDGDLFTHHVIVKYLTDHPYVIDHETLNELMLYHWLSRCTQGNFMLGYVTLSILTMALFLFIISLYQG